MQKKGRGRLIHVSDFIEEPNGRLICRNELGNISWDARKVVYPGANGDPYWDCKQLIAQVRNSAIPIFEAAHPGCQALFVFDQSSAHAALPEDALKAFEMNKGNVANNADRRTQLFHIQIPPKNTGESFKV